MANESETKRAERIIAIRDAEFSRQANFRQLWQDTADWILPMFAKITTKRVPGEPLGVELHDITARTEARNMASGLSSAIIPAGQQFFDLRAGDKAVRDDPEVEEYLAELTEDVHQEMFATNFTEEFNSALTSLVVFGNSATLPRWTVKTGLVYRTYPIGSYQIRADSDGKIDTLILTVKRTARQLRQQFPDTIGEHVQKSLDEQDRGGDSQINQDFEIIQIVQPRADFNPDMIDNLNMPWESVFIGVLDRNVLEESGFEKFPFSVPRWFRSPGETDGRGQGTELLPQVRKTNQMEADKTQAGNRWVEPPLEVSESFDGTVNLSPRAQNFTVEMGSIAAIDLGAKGSYPISREELAEQRDIIKEGFFKSTFEPLTPLTGDRRNVEEIRGRLNEAFKKLSNPLGRIFTEKLNIDIELTVVLLVKNGVARQPPPQLRKVAIEYIGPAAKALVDQHIIAFDNWFAMGERIEPLIPGTLDNIDVDEAFRDVGRGLGVKESYLRKIGPRDAMRAQRQKDLAEQAELEAAQVVAGAYGQTTKAPEPGSGAEALQQEVA